MNYALTFITFILLVSCNNPNDEQESKYCSYPDTLAEPTNKTTFLSFKFGSTADEFEQHYFKLQDEKKIFKSDYGGEFYRFDVEGLRETFFRIYPNFYNDSLSSLNLTAESFSSSKDFVILSRILELKFGKPYCSKKENIVWVNNNVGITLSTRYSQALKKDYVNLNYEQISYQTRNMKNFIAHKGDTTIIDIYGYTATYDIEYFKKHIQAELNKSSIKDL